MAPLPIDNPKIHGFGLASLGFIYLVKWNFEQFRSCRSVDIFAVLEGFYHIILARKFGY